MSVKFCISKKQWVFVGFNLFIDSEYHLLIVHCQLQQDQRNALLDYDQ